MNSQMESGQQFATAVMNHEKENQLMQAIESHQAGRLAEAMQAYQRVLAVDNTNYVALNNLSLLLDDSAALQILKTALDLAPNYLDALINITFRLINQNNKYEALKYVKRAEKIAPNDARIAELMGRLDITTTEVVSTWTPEYSVIIPTHRRGKLLARALSSIKQQHTAIRYEIIVVSDCEDALTDEVCKQLLESTDTYVRRSGPPGPSASRNLALKLVKGKTVLFLDDDDAWHPNLLASLNTCEPLQRGQSVYFNCSVVKESRKLGEPTCLDENFFNTEGALDECVFVKNQVHMSCFAFPRIFLLDLEFDTHMKAYEDWDFLLSVFEKKMPVHVPIMGSQIHEVDDDSSDRRGNSLVAKDFNAVIDYLYVYHRHPVNKALQEKRADLLANVGLELLPDQL